MTTAAPELLTVPQVMTRLKVGRTKVYDLISTRRLVSITTLYVPLLPEPRGQAGHGAGQGEAQRRRTVLRAGRPGWAPCKALTFAQAEAVLKGAEGTSVCTPTSSSRS
jgi:hypothetical protein